MTPTGSRPVGCPTMTIGSTLVTSIAPLLVTLQAEAPLPPFVIGLIAFLALLAMMGVVLSMGKGRPHS
jgi:hypothetical protein